jgi:hypothetical protein
MKQRLQRLAAVSLLVFGQVAIAVSAMPQRALATVPGVNEIISVGASTQSNGHSQRPGISGDGRFVAFESTAANLVTGDTNNKSDVFVRDRQSAVTTRVSVSSGGLQGNNESYEPQISYDGRYVVFSSLATNLITGDTNNHPDVFIHDRQSGSTSLVSASAAGTIGNHFSNRPDVSQDGRFVVFETSASNLATGILPSGVGQQIVVKDMQTGVVKAVSANGGVQGNGVSDWPTISCDGSVVTYHSQASNLVIGDTNGVRDVFVATLVSGGYQQSNITLSANSESIQPDVSCDGSAVVFLSTASNLVPGDTNGNRDAFVYSKLTGQIVRASVTNSGAQSSGQAHAYRPSISGDGRYVAFHSTAGDLDSFTGGPSGKEFGNIFMRDMVGQTTQAISRNDNFLVGYSKEPAISGDGLHVAYNNLEAPTQGYGKLVASDSNGFQDIFVSATGITTDVVPPTVTGAPDRQPNGSGWYDADVTITWSVTDPDPSSGTPSTPPPTLANQEGTHAYASGQSCDPANNCATGSLTLSIDKSAPTITYSLSQAPNGADWNNQDVTVTFSCDDAVSGVASCSPPQTVGEGANQTVDGTATDLAGNTAAVQLTLNVDKTLPTIAYTVASGAPISAAGWYKNDVTVSFQCADGLSGLLSCSDPVTLTDEGPNQTVAGSAEDAADNTNASTLAVSIDKTAPVVTSQSFSPNPKSVTQSSVTLTAQVDDALSGVNYVEYYDPVLQTWQAMTLNGSTATALVNTSFMFYPAGTYTFQVRAWDRADNQSLPMSVVLYVYNPGGGYVTGTGFVDPGGPSSEPGDNLPAVSGNNPKAVFGFNVRYDNPLATFPTGSSTFTYGQACNSPNNTCFSVTTDSFTWLIVPGTNDAAVFQGSATLGLNGQTLGSNYPVRVWVEDNGPTDHYILRVYAVNADPETASPLYQASGDPNGSILVHP